MYSVTVKYILGMAPFDVLPDSGGDPHFHRGIPVDTSCLA